MDVEGLLERAGRIGQNLLSNAQQIFPPLLRHQLGYLEIVTSAWQVVPVPSSGSFLERRTQIPSGQKPSRPERFNTRARVFLQAGSRARSARIAQYERQASLGIFCACASSAASTCTINRVRPCASGRYIACHAIWPLGYDGRLLAFRSQSH